MGKNGYHVIATIAKRGCKLKGNTFNFEIITTIVLQYLAIPCKATNRTTYGKNSGWTAIATTTSND